MPFTVHQLRSLLTKAFLFSALLLVAQTSTLASSARMDNALNTFFCRTFCTSFGCQCRETLEMCKQCEPLGKSVSGCFKVEPEQSKWCFMPATKVFGWAFGAFLKGASGGVRGSLAGAKIGKQVGDFFGLPINIMTMGSSGNVAVSVSTVVGSAVGGILGALSSVFSGGTGGVAASEKFTKNVVGVIGAACGLLKLGDQKPPSNLMGMFCTMLKVAEHDLKEAKAASKRAPPEGKK